MNKKYTIELGLSIPEMLADVQRKLSAGHNDLFTGYPAKYIYSASSFKTHEEFRKVLGALADFLDSAQRDLLAEMDREEEYYKDEEIEVDGDLQYYRGKSL